MYTPGLVPFSLPVSPHTRAAGVPSTSAARHGASARTPMAYARAVVDAYAQRGLDAGAALAAAQIAPENLTQQDARITAAQMEQLCAHAMRELDDEALGWFRRRLPWGSYGMLVRASISSPTLGLALSRWCRHHGLLTDDVSLQLVRDGQGPQAMAELRLLEQCDMGAKREFCTVSLLRNVHGVASWLLDTRLPLRHASFAFSPHAHADAYPEMFPGPIAFNAPWSCLRFDAHWLEQPVARDEAALQLMLQQALSIQVRPYRRERQWSARVRQLLVADVQLQHTGESLAQALLVSPRSLHRQLHAEGQSLQRIKDAVRTERAIHLLLRSQQPLKRIALACGFASDKSFLRAFETWTGHSPAEYRALHKIA